MAEVFLEGQSYVINLSLEVGGYGPFVCKRAGGAWLFSWDKPGEQRDKTLAFTVQEEVVSLASGELPSFCPEALVPLEEYEEGLEAAGLLYELSKQEFIQIQEEEKINRAAAELLGWLDMEQPF